jgi:D-3-phosphoglycerate dehydrogenase / 2-oxoglutarate reductase
MSRTSVVITTSSFAQDDPGPLDVMKERGLDIRINPHGRKLTRPETVELCSGCAGIIAGTEIYDREVLEKLEAVKVISRCGTGIDAIDVPVLRRLGIKLFNTPDAPTLAVAELTIGLMLSLLRAIPLMDRETHQDGWQKRMGNLLTGKNVGIIGFGRIGRKVADLLAPFNCGITWYDVDQDMHTECAHLRCRELDELLKTSDIVTIHVSRAAGGCLIGERELRKMKQGAWLINTARGEAVDEEALYRAIERDHLSGAGLDAFQREPYEGPLKNLPQVILTPHIGSYARESRIEMEMQAVRNLLEGLGAE